MSKKQFETSEQIKEALQPGVVYYRMYGPSEEPEKSAHTVVRQEIDESEGYLRVVYKTNRSDFEHKEYIGDMQNCKGKAVFTDLSMAKNWDEEFKSRNIGHMEYIPMTYFYEDENTKLLKKILTKVESIELAIKESEKC